MLYLPDFQFALASVQWQVTWIETLCRNLLSDCFYSLTRWSFPTLDDPWRSGCHYDDLFRPSALCDPQFHCLDFERIVWNGCECKGAVLSLQLKQTTAVCMVISESCSGLIFLSFLQSDLHFYKPLKEELTVSHVC